MTRIAKINLNICKDKPIANDPIVLQQGEKDLIIEATIDNSEYAEIIQNATFQATKPDGTHILNDPANISGNVISYAITKHLTNTAGKITNANFYINNNVNTVPFEIDITPGVEIGENGDPTDYIPGFDIVQRYMSEFSLEWSAKFKEMSHIVDSTDVPTEFKTLMDKYLDDIKNSYKPTIDNLKALADTEITSLADKEQSIDEHRKEVDQAFENLKVKTSSIIDFLQTVQNQILDTNEKFQSGQKDVITKFVSDSKNEVNQNIKSINDQIANEIKSLNSQGQDAIAQLKIDNSKQIDSLKAQSDTAIKSMNDSVSALRTGMSNYNTKTEITSLLSKYATTSAVTTNTNSINSINTTLSSKANKSDLNNYQTKSDVNSQLTDYLKGVKTVSQAQYDAMLKAGTLEERFYRIVG